MRLSSKAFLTFVSVMDSVPLPVEGSETRVIADDAQAHMIALADSMEKVRRFALCD